MEQEKARKPLDSEAAVALSMYLSNTMQITIQILLKLITYCIKWACIFGSYFFKEQNLKDSVF